MSANPKFETAATVRMRRGRPATKLAVVTAQLPPEKSDDIGQIYKPPEWGWRLLIAFLTSDKRPAIQEACKKASISRDTFYRHANNPEFVRWFEKTKKEALSATLSEIQLEHFWLCKQANDERVRLDAITEYEDRFIPRDAQVVESLPSTMRDVTPIPRQYPVQIQDKSEQVKALLSRVIEHSIKKAKVYGQDIPKDLEGSICRDGGIRKRRSRLTRNTIA